MQQVGSAQLASVREHFDAVGPFYDEASRTCGWIPNDVMARHLHRIPVPREVCDLGCGTGQTSDALRRSFPAANIIAVDVSMRMLGGLSAGSPAPGVVGDVVCSDVQDFVWATAAGRFDLIASVGAFEYLGELLALFGPLRRIVATGGSLIFTYEPLPAPDAEPVLWLESACPGTGDLAIHRHRSGDVRAALSASGFDVIAAERFTPYARWCEPVVYELLVCAAVG